MIDVGPHDKRHCQPSCVIEPHPPLVRDGQPQRRHNKRAQQAPGYQQGGCAAVGDGELEGVAVRCPDGVAETRNGHFGHDVEIGRFHGVGSQWLPLSASLVFPFPFPPLFLLLLLLLLPFRRMANAAQMTQASSCLWSADRRMPGLDHDAQKHEPFSM